MMHEDFDACEPNKQDAEAVDRACLVLLHGFAQTERSWNNIADELVKRTGRAVYAYAFSGETDMYELACDALIEYLLSFEIPPVVVGYSMGGRMALSALCRWIQRGAGQCASSQPCSDQLSPSRPLCSGLVLESAGLGPVSDAERASVQKRNEEWAAYARTQGVEAFATMWEELPLFATQKELPDQVRADIRQERLSHDAETLAVMLEAMGAHVMPSQDEVEAAIEQLTQAGAPVLYVAGSLDTKYSGVAQQLKVRFEGEPGVRTVVVDGCGHNVHAENPRAFAEILTEFCAR